MDYADDQKRESLILKGRMDFSSAYVIYSKSLEALATKLNELYSASILKNSEALLREINGIDRISARIKEISIKSRMLSINASIEAARAGAAGKGFAVVAEEFGNLTNQTVSFTKEIGDVNQNMLSIGAENNELIKKYCTDLSELISADDDAAQSVTSILISMMRIEDNGFILTSIAKYFEAHANFLTHLLKNAGGNAPIPDYHSCAFGKWYDANRGRFGDIEEFEAIDGIHARFHTTAREYNEQLQLGQLLSLQLISNELAKAMVKLFAEFERLVKEDISYFEDMRARK